ncbi:MAG: 30S ribosomal protein S6 [Deltaproteobacteria bacterium]|jgi:small subunit ribosomal protein S6|nr:30S ribosomal protein S6 [Deltaproteobacteria bacterium]
MHPRRYETLILVSPNLTSEEYSSFKKKVEQILSDGRAQILRSEDQGRKTLAYPVKKELHGNYYLFDYQSTPEVSAELKRNLKIDEVVYKHLTVVLDYAFTDERFAAEKARIAAKTLKKESPEPSEDSDERPARTTEAQAAPPKERPAPPAKSAAPPADEGPDAPSAAPEEASPTPAEDPPAPDAASPTTEETPPTPDDDLPPLGDSPAEGQ